MGWKARKHGEFFYVSIGTQHRERCEAAEVAAQRVRDIHKSILSKWQRMAKEGVLYSSAERKADSDALEEANKEFQLILVSVYEIEDAERQ